MSTKIGPDSGTRAADLERNYYFRSIRTKGSVSGSGEPLDISYR
jgi:hypothetical protein